MHEPLPQRTAVQIDVAVKHVLGRDIETRSTIILKKVGAHKYAADPALERVNCKDAAGERLMHAMSKPRKPRSRVAAADLTPFPSHSEGAHRGAARPDQQSFNQHGV